ncbi:NAD(P)-binding protein [Aspergillus floccosus]
MPPNPGFAIVTPASRGLGFAFARHLLAHTDLPVVATARRNCDELRKKLLKSVNGVSKAEDRLRIYEADVNDESTISSMASQIQQTLPETPLRLAITVPGILHVEKSPSQIDASLALDSFRVNALGPMLLMKHLSQFLPTKASSPFEPHPLNTNGHGKGMRLPSHAIYAMMAARVGSISDNGTGGWYSYRASKAAVFQLAKTFDLYLRTRSKDLAVAVAMHPGTVRTEFTKEYWSGREMLQPEESAERLLRVLCSMGAGVGDGRGKCWDWRGEEVLP